MLIASPPRQLYALGDKSVLTGKRVAIVGTRRPTAYGRRIAAGLAARLAREGVCIVSGMAYGIDAEAHRAALSVGGKTAAVLGGGVDLPYPAAHRSLHRQIVEEGVVVSEFSPGTANFKGCFPRRNRIIAGLSDLTIVVEAQAKSGALITANYALDAGIPVAAVPGPIDSPGSMGPNTLIRDGAHPIVSVDEVLTLMGLGTVPSTGQAKLALRPDEQLVYQALEGDSLSLDALIVKTGLPTSRCLVAITELELQGLIANTLSGLLSRL